MSARRALLLAAMTVAACGDPAGPGEPQVKWSAVTVGGIGVLPDTELTLVLAADNALSGSAGCNRFRGGYRRDGDDIYVTALALTRMACAMPPGIMEQEQRYVALLESAYRIDESADRLTLTPEGAEPGIEFRRSEVQ